jgi:glyoxylase-like metal-dependent hydrolase (beta-lactamase superfamily II)
MRIHHLNCGTMCPVSEKLVNGGGALFDAGLMICHCLLVETNDGLVLVDTGLGLGDVADARGRLGHAFLWATRPRLDPAETAARQVERLGFKRSDVRHVVPTHLDLDHAGGISDFPDAMIHVFELEHAAALHPPTLHDRARYRRPHWAHGPRWAVHALEGETWLGFEAIRVIERVGPDVLLVPLTGHSRGHCGIAVRTERGWILHAGDAYFSYHEMDPVDPWCPGALAAFQRVAAVSTPKRIENQARLRELARTHPDDLELICAHCPHTFERYATPKRAETRLTSGVAVPTV